jgi:transketolase
VCYNNVPVKIVGSHAGISVGPDGGTHQAIEDIAITRVIPNIEVIVPCDALEAYKATIAMAQSNKPGYLRLAREKTPIVTTTETPFEICKALILYESTVPQIAIVAIGPMVHQSLLAAKQLEQGGIGTIVINSATVKPLDSETIINVAKRVQGMVTAETHQRAGGLGGAIAELLSERYQLPLQRVGIDDKFGQSGTGDELMEHYGLGVNDIIKAVYAIIKSN